MMWKVFILILIISIQILCIDSKKKEVTTTIHIDGKEYMLTYLPTLAGAKEMAESFCNSETMRDKSDLQDCMKTITEYLISSISKPTDQNPATSKPPVQDDRVNDRKSQNKSKRKPKAAKTERDATMITNDSLSVEMVIAGKNYVVRYTPATETTQAAARHFCESVQDELGITIETLDNCIDPVRQHLDTVFRDYRGPKQFMATKEL